METNETMMVQDNGPLAALTRLQMEVGYEPDTMNFVALLGMFGEAGEVLEEVGIELCPKSTAVDAAFLDTIRNARHVAKQIDAWKKAIREKEYTPCVTVTVEPDFKKELADQMYYMNALALGINSSLQELAIIVANKVRTKMVNKPIGHANQ